MTDSCFKEKPDDTSAKEFERQRAALAHIKENVIHPKTVRVVKTKHYKAGPGHITTIDFYSVDAYGKEAKQRWTFSFEKEYGHIVNVLKVAGAPVP